ncbi:phage tail protein [Chryseobacterium indoltheticum]|uniref:phage tail protein n=1 Tax=Chryseobacterium indoltheticum TaxID=254 RepID=UPI00404236C8
MKAATPVEKDNKVHQNHGKNQRQKEPSAIPLSETEVIGAQIQKTEDSSTKSGSVNLNGSTAAVHGSQTIYDQGSEIMYQKHQESLAETGDINHPDTKNIEKGYMTTLSIDQARDYNDLKSGTYLPKTVEEQAVMAQNVNSNSETSTSPNSDSGVLVDPVQNSTFTPDASEGLVLPAEQEDVAVRTTPTDPHSDPQFNQTVSLVKNTAKAKRTHTTKEKAENQANAAAKVPGGERKSKARGQQVEKLDQQKADPFKPSDFKAKLKSRVDKMQLPTNEKEVENFEAHNNIAKVNQLAGADVVASKNNVTGSIEKVAKQEPSESQIQQRVATSLPDPKIGSKVNIKATVPGRRGDAELSEPVTKGYKAVEQQFEKNNITDEQLASSNEPAFINALNAKKAAKENAENTPGEFKAAESKKLESSKQDAQGKTNNTMEGMHHSRKEMLDGVTQKQHKAGEKNTGKHQDVVAQLNQIYADTKKSVDAQLNDLETKVTQLFDAGAKVAKDTFEKYVTKKTDEYKEKRYGSWYDVRGYGKRIKDGWNGKLPDEVNVFFTEGRKLFLAKLDGTINLIANLVTDRLNKAKAAITSGRQKVTTFIKNLPADVKKAIKGDIDAIQGQFKQLENSISEKESSLIDSLVTKYNNTLKEVDDMVDEFKKRNQGFLSALKDATLGVWETIQNIKKTLTDLLSGAVDVILSIIAHPIDFLSNLIAGVSQGFTNFGANIWTHLKTGFFGWLTGAMKNVSITMPEDIFSLKGIFSITTQMLGLTWNGIRDIGAKVVGEPVMKVLETGFEMVQIVRKDGVAGLWEHLKDQFADLKETVMDAIMDIIQSQVIQAGIKWIMGLMTPVGAFIKAAMAIIDVVKFFIQRAAQIMELVKAFTESIKAIASGNVGAVAKSIENSLGRAIPVLIGFLASLLGIGGLADKVIGVIQKIRERIVKAITKFWTFVKGKAKGLLGKVGVGGKNVKTKDIEKDNTKDWDDIRVPFTAEDRHQHTLYFDNKGGNTVLMVASTPKTFSDFIADIKVENNDERAQKAKRNAIKIASDIDARKKERINDDKDKEQKKKMDISSMTKALSKFVAVLFGIDQQEGLPESEIKHSSKSTNEGILGTSMVAKVLTRKGINGSEPKETNKIYKDLSYRMYGNGSYYVRGHLLNEHMHGEGILVNLTPLSQQGNKNHLRVAEEPIKIAVLGGAIVEYTLLVKYGQSIPEVSDNELEQAGFESEEDKEKVRKIRKAEQHVPKGLTLRSNYLKKEGNNYVKDKLLVVNNSVLNPVDFDIKSYQINKVKKEKVSILHSSADEISKNTPLKVEGIILIIIDAAKKVANLNKYEQILEQIPNANREIQRGWKTLKDAKNVTLK